MASKIDSEEARCIGGIERPGVDARIASPIALCARAKRNRAKNARHEAGHSA
jgi:hypothetical protein